MFSKTLIGEDVGGFPIRLCETRFPSHFGWVRPFIHSALILAPRRRVSRFREIRLVTIARMLFARSCICGSFGDTLPVSWSKVFWQILRWFHRVFARCISVPSQDVMYSSNFLCMFDDPLYSVFIAWNLVLVDVTRSWYGLARVSLLRFVSSGFCWSSFSSLTSRSSDLRGWCMSMFSFATGACQCFRSPLALCLCLYRWCHTIRSPRLCPRTFFFCFRWWFPRLWWRFVPCLHWRSCDCNARKFPDRSISYLKRRSRQCSKYAFAS